VPRRHGGAAAPPPTPHPARAPAEPHFLHLKKVPPPVFFCAVEVSPRPAPQRPCAAARRAPPAPRPRPGAQPSLRPEARRAGRGGRRAGGAARGLRGGGAGKVESMAEQEALEEALASLCREDPSLSVRVA
jgi:hypothetical protein